MKKITLEELKIYVKSNNRICPMPTKWLRMHEIIKRHSVSKTPPNLMPLILGGWEASDDEKTASGTDVSDDCDCGEC